MESKIIIQKRENKTKRLFIPITPTEQAQIKSFCRDKQIKMSDFIRIAINNTFGIL